MIITKIEKTGKKCRLYLNDAPAFCLYPSEVRKLRLKEGEDLDQEHFAEICTQILEKRAEKRCLLILQKADQTQRQLRDKLTADEYPEQVIEKAMEYVRSYGYVDDLKYACRYIENMQETRSVLRMKTDLLKKGIAAGIIEDALEKAEHTNEKDQIRRLLEKRHYDPSGATPKERQKMIRFLLGRGYRYDQISKEIDIDEQQV